MTNEECSDVRFTRAQKRMVVGKSLKRRSAETPFSKIRIEGKLLNRSFRRKWDFTTREMIRWKKISLMKL